MTRAQLESAIARCDHEIQACVENQSRVPQEQKWMALMGEVDFTVDKQEYERELALLVSEEMEGIHD